MTDDEIIKMAKQAGGRFSRNPDKYDVMEITYCGLEAFAKLVAEKEREECAKICEEIYTGEEACGDWPTPEMCANAIRARGDNA